MWIVEAETWLEGIRAHTGSKKERTAVVYIVFQHLGYEKKGKDRVKARGGYSVIGRFSGSVIGRYLKEERSCK